jgi:Ala-tRNA(Pro) deacylase
MERISLTSRRHAMYILDFLRSRDVWFEALLYRPASSSAKRARSAGVPGRRVAKAVLVKTGDSFVLAVLPSTSRIDLSLLSQVVGAPASEVRLATSDELLAMFPDCELGVVPAFGRLYGLTTLVEAALAEGSDILVGANTRHEGLWMHFRDFQALEQPMRASFCVNSAGEPRKPDRGRRGRRRRAG